MATGLYPDLSEAMDADEDILAALNAPPKPKRPPRPPPPAHSASEGDVASTLVNLPSAATNTSSPGSRRQSAPVGVANAVPIPVVADAAPSVVVPYPLLPSEVRWFYQEPGKFWQAFSGYDSLSLEEAYLRQLEKGSSEADVMVMGELHEVSVRDRTCRPIYWTVKEPWKVLRGYWYEVIGERWYPLPEAEYTLIEAEHTQRKWREKAKADAELHAWAVSGKPAHKQPKEIASQPLNSVIVNKLVVDKYEVWWMGGGDIYKMKKEMSTQFLNKVGEKFGKGQLVGATKLVRGHKESAVWLEKLPPIGHLVFVIHGIGQNMDQSDISKSCSDFRETCTQIAKKNFPEQWKQRRVEFLPVEWRTWLSLDKGMLKMITPHGVAKLRELMNDSALDILYYMSPKFGPEILDGLKFALQKQYTEFTKRHPDFVSSGGTVSIMAHSLGSVMAYDLLHQTCESMGIDHCNPADSHDYKNASSGPVKVTLDEGVRFKAGMGDPEPDRAAMESEEQTDDLSEEMLAWRELRALRQRVAELEQQLDIGEKQKKKGLHFTVDHFFAVGSPLAVFILMREHETLVKRNHRSAASILPSHVCRRIHNLHHPSDPVAYRLEPLIHEGYSQIKPVRVDSASSKPSQEAVGHAGGKLASGQQSKPQAQSKGWFSNLFSSSSSSSSSSSTAKDSAKTKPPSDKVLNSDKNLRSREKLRERLDFMLRENFTDISYVNSLTAHTGYWTSPDCAQYVLLQLYSYTSCPVEEAETS